MNKQELFTTIYERMVTQGVPAYSGGDCLYQGPNNTHCAIGCVLPPEHPAFEIRSGIRSIMIQYPDLEDTLGDDIDFLEEIQQAHDYPIDEAICGNLAKEWLPEFKSRMSVVALQYKLEIPGE